MLNPTTVPTTRSTSLLRNLPTRAEWRLLYAVTAIPVHLWAILMFFYSLPSYLMRMSIWNMLGVLAYVLSLALLESLLITAVLALISLGLPYRFFKQYFVPQGVLTVLLLSIWMIPAHFALVDPGQQSLGAALGMFSPVIWLLSLVAAVAGLSILLRRKPGLGRVLTDIAERFTLLSSVYILLDVFCLVVVILRLLL